MRLIRRLALLALLAGLFAWLRKVLSDQVVERMSDAGPPAGEAERKPASSAGSSGGSSGNGSQPTKAELYERAQELGIEGRSRMSKAELQREISRRD
jgi:Rho termination factor, N-terminal domain